MNKVGLFGGGWEDYLNALNDAFDRHVAENMPPHPFGASVDAIMTGYPDDADVPPELASGGASSAGATALLPVFQSSAAPQVSDLFLRNSAQTTPVMRPLGSDGPAQPADLNQGSAAAGSHKATDGLGAVAGYPEAGSGAYRAGNDAVIRKAVADYNDRNGYRPGDPGYMTPELMKAWQMQESGGSRNRAAFESDPFQVNNIKDWDDHKAKIGLTKGQAMTPETSAEAALKWLQYKSWVHDDSGNPTIYKGLQGFDRYNGGGVKDYGSSVLNHYNQSWGK